MDHQVFISYSSRDALLAERIHDRLERDGIGCWISSRDVPPGADFQGCIVEAIDAAKLVLLVFSSEANHSNEIAKELSLASKKLLIPVRIEDVLPEGAFRFQLTNRQFFDLFQDFDRRLDDLSRTVQAALAGTPVQDARSGTTSTPGEGTAWRLPVAILAMLLVVAGAWWWLRPPPDDVLPNSVAGNTAGMSAPVETPAQAGTSDRPDAAPALPPVADPAQSASPIPAEPAFLAAPTVSPQPAPDSVAPAHAPSPQPISPPTPAATAATSTGTATGPSFDCAKANTRVERAICADAELGRLDRQLSMAYRDARTRSSNRTALQRQQNIWRREVRDACDDDACIVSAHERRIRQLETQ